MKCLYMYMYLIVSVSSSCGDGVDALVALDFTEGLLCCKSSFDFPPLLFLDEVRSGDSPLKSSSNESFDDSSCMRLLREEEEEKYQERKKNYETLSAVHVYILKCTHVHVHTWIEYINGLHFTRVLVLNK